MKTEKNDLKAVGKTLRQSFTEIEKALRIQQEMVGHLTSQFTTLHKILQTITALIVVAFLVLLVFLGFLRWA